MINNIKIPATLNFIRKFEFPRKLGILENLYGKKLNSLGVGWVICSNGVVWKLDLKDPCQRWIVYGKYEGGAGIDLAKEKLKDGGVYVDSGANIGQWALYISNQKGVKTIAFEPVKSERCWLTKCVLAQKDWDISILPFGLGSKEVFLEIQKNGSRSTLHLDWYQGKNYEREKIEIRRIESVLEEMNIEKVTFWKLDVEGAELEALKGAENYLRDKRIEHIFFECHPTNYTKIRELFGLYNYGIFDLIDGKLIEKLENNILNTENLVAALTTQA